MNAIDDIGTATGTVLVIGGTGKTGRRVAARLEARGVPVRIGSRSASPAFDWDDPATWAAALDGAVAAYVTYYPDLMVPEAAERVGAFARQAVAAGVRRLVLLSGRGEPGAQASEDALRASGAEWTVLRCSWFAQNFSENFLVDGILAGEVALPVGTVGEPFIDADDIADAAVAALTDRRLAERVPELTGPRLLTFAEAVATIAGATGRPVRFESVAPERFAAMLEDAGLPDDLRRLVLTLFAEVLDGRNAEVTDDLPRLLGRPARDFAAYARTAAAAGAWGGVPDAAD